MQLKSPKDLAIKARMMGKKTISYSQFNMYKTCPHQWKLNYIDKHKEFEPSIYLTFGTSMHEVIQHYLEVMYNDSVKNADSIDLHKMLKERMQHNYKETLAEFDGKHFSSQDQMMEFYWDGVEIIDYLKRKRGAYFSKKNCELVGIEMPIFHEIESNPNIMMTGFIDLVIKEHDRIKIIDIKTSTMGWRPSQKKENGDQLRIYKEYFAKQYNVDVKDIDVEYFIVKRKLYENLDFPQRRIQQYRPAAGKPSLSKVNKNLDKFITEAFTLDGKHNISGFYPATKGEKNKNCKWCPFKTNYELCPKQNRVVA